MRTLPFLFVFLILAGCSARDTAITTASNDISFVVGARFSVNIPADDLVRARVMSADGFIISYEDGSHTSFDVVMPELEGLPHDFDMRAYPEYLLGLRDPSDLSSEQAASFKTSAEMLLSSIRDSEISQYAHGEVTAYIVTGKGESLAFVVDDSVSDQLFFVSSFTGGAHKLREFVKGVNHAER